MRYPNSVMATADFGGMAVEFPTSQETQVQRTITFHTPIQLGEDDLVAALWRFSQMGGLDADELADPDAVREIAADQVVNAGLEEINEAHHRVCRIRPGSEDDAWLQEIRAAVRRAFAPVLPRGARSRSCGTRRVLAGVAQ